MPYLSNVDHDEAIDLRVLLLVKATIGERHAGRMRVVLSCDCRSARLLERWCFVVVLYCFLRQSQRVESYHVHAFLEIQSSAAGLVILVCRISCITTPGSICAKYEDLHVPDVFVFILAR